MVDLVYVPTFPPAAPYEAYLYLLVIPLLLRLILVLPPLIDLLQKFSPDKMIIWQAGRSLKIRGLWVIVVNEVLAIFLPFILALYARTLFQPIGWPDWALVPTKGIYALAITAVLWLFVDFLRVSRTRRLIRSVSEQNRIMVKAAAHGVIHARGALGFFEKISVRNLFGKNNEEQIDEEGVEPRKKSFFGSLFGMGASVGEKGLETADAALGVVRDQASKLSGKMEGQLQKGIHEQSKVALKLMVRDLIMSLAPIVVLVGLHNIW
jgi:hypothetical protein